MTYEEAIALLKTAPRDGKPSRINRGLTRQQATEIIEKAVLSYKDSGIALDELMEKRVHQVTQDRKRISPAF